MHTPVITYENATLNNRNKNFPKHYRIHPIGKKENEKKHSGHSTMKKTKRDGNGMEAHRIAKIKDKNQILEDHREDLGPFSLPDQPT